MNEIQAVIAISIEAGRRILGYYDDAIEVTQKEDNSPLTLADLAAHHYIIEELSKITNDPVISEESEIPDYDSRKNWNTFWLVDPLDGTKEFIKKNGEFTVNIAKIEYGCPVLGVVYAPALDILYFADEKGAYKQINGEKSVRIYSEISGQLDRIKVVVSRSHGSDAQEKWISEHNVSETVPSGSSLKLCLVADGTADVYPRLGPTMEWDVAAGDAVYRYSAKQGVHPSPLTYNKPDLRNGDFIIGM